MEVPFTTEQFFEIFEKYNTTFFPVQILLFVLGVFGLFLIHSKSKFKDILIGGFLGLLWLWIGIAYHFSFFTLINPAAYAFGGLFVLQGLFILMETFFVKRLKFEVPSSSQHYFGYFFILFGLIIYSVISYLVEGSFNRTITLGLPCPSTILTFGFFLLATRRFPKYLLLIPSLWAIIGTVAAINFGVYQDYVMILAAIVANIYVLRITKKVFLTTGLAITQAFNGISGLLGGYMLINDPSGSTLNMKLEWLEKTPFPNFLIPGIILLLFIGLANVIGFGFTVFKKAKAGLWGTLFGLILMIWIISQVLWIGYKDFLQPLYFSVGMLQAIFGFLSVKHKTLR